MKTITKYKLIMGNWCKEIFGNIASLIGIIALIVVLILIVFRITIPFDKLDNTGIIISFIGVLATFIVIGNFAQTSRIEDQLKKDIGDVNIRLKDCEKANEQLKVISKTIDEHNKTLNSLGQLDKSLDRQDLAHLLKLFVGKEGDVRKYMQLYAKMLDPDSSYHIELVDRRQEIVKIEYGENIKDLVFRKSAKEEIEPQHISKISGLSFNYTDILFAYQLLHDMEMTNLEVKEEEKTKEEISDSKEEKQG